MKIMWHVHMLCHLEDHLLEKASMHALECVILCMLGGSDEAYIHWEFVQTMISLAYCWIACKNEGP